MLNKQRQSDAYRALALSVMFNMNSRATVLAIFLSCPLYANDIQCPEGTTVKGETTPELREAWCEFSLETKTVVHGPYKAWYPNGVLGNSGQYEEGIPVGTWYSWYDTGEKQGEEVFKNGEIISTTIWEKNGTVVEK